MKKSSSGQAPVLAAVLFLFLVPTTIIIAQNATTNITGDIVANLSLPNATVGNVSLEIPLNQSLPVNGSGTSFAPNQTAPMPGPLNETAVVNTTDATEAANATEPDAFGNSTANQTLAPLNQTLPDPSGQGQAINVTPVLNATIPGQALPEEANGTETESLGPDIELTLDIPDRTDRNQPFTASALASNTGDTEARGVEIEWILPEGLSIIEGSGILRCDIAPGETCRSDLTVAASLSSMLGKQEIKAIARYRA